MKKLIMVVILFCLFTGCSTLTITAPDGTSISHTRMFDDQQMQDVEITSKDFQGRMGNFSNAGKIDLQTLGKIFQSMAVAP